MSLITFFIMASFTAPQNIGTEPQYMLLLLPLSAAVAIVYKATKVPTIKASSFIKEVVVLFSSIVVFIIVTALALFALAWLITE